MKYTLFWILLLCFSANSNCQTINTEHVIELGKYYSSFMFRNDPPKSTTKDLGKEYATDMASALDFIKEASKSKNKLLSNKYLTLPDNQTLKIIYLVDALHQNPHKENVLDPQDLVDYLKTTDIPIHELVDEYYSTLFTAVGNKNKPFNLSKIDFEMKNYNLSNDRLKSIFYLRCMDFCGDEIYGYMNIVKPPNTSKALNYIEKYPKFNGLKYYQYTDLHFEDFEMELFNDKGNQSYKDYFLNVLYSTLLNHVICLKSEDRDQEEINDVLLGSILKDNSLYKHTIHKNTLESIFKKQ